MTKIKNTKKGMAKKTLSMSLVVAMLATSNVPVWAAEFSDGSDASVATEAPVAETFSDDVAEAPVVEDTTEADTTDAATVTEAGDLILDDVTITKSATFGANEKVAVSGTIKYKDGSDVKELKDYYFGWRVKGTTNAIFTDRVASDNTTDKMSFIPDFADASSWTASQARHIDWSEYAGKTLELYVYNNENPDDINIAPTVIGETTINKCAIEGTLNLNKTSNDLEYNGKDFYYTDNTADGSDNAVKLVNSGAALTVTKGDTVPGVSGSTWTAATVLKYFDVAATKTAKNANEKLTVTATAKADSPYTGTISAKELEVQKKRFNASDFDLSVAEGLSYQYTGAAISVPTDKVSFKEKADKLAGVDLSSAVKKAETATTAPADQANVKVILDTTKLKNFDFAGVTGYDDTQKEMTLTTSGVALNQNVEITKRDLNADSTSITLKYGRVPQGTSVDQFAQYNLVFKDKSGTELKLRNNSDYTLFIKDPDNQTVTSTQSFNKVGTYIVTISANEQSNPTCKNGQILEVRVASNVIATASFTNTYAPYYTGTELKPTKEELGKLVISNVNGTVANETLKDDEWEITGYSNNVEASKYDKNGNITTYGYVEIKVKGDSSYAGQTYKVPFEIKPLTVSADSVTVPKTVTYNKGNGPASDYKVH